MRRIVSRTILSVTFLAAPVTAVAGLSLSPIMESWNHSKRSIDAMLSGRTPYDEAEIRRELQRYVDNASRVAREVRGGTAEARDFAARFEAFANDSRSALGTVSQPAAMAARFSRMLGDCQSCHDVYNN
jgi:cytochrome c556